MTVRVLISEIFFNFSSIHSFINFRIRHGPPRRESSRHFWPDFFRARLFQGAAQVRRGVCFVYVASEIKTSHSGLRARACEGADHRIRLVCFLVPWIQVRVLHLLHLLLTFDVLCLTAAVFGLRIRSSASTCRGNRQVVALKTEEDVRFFGWAFQIMVESRSQREVCLFEDTTNPARDRSCRSSLKWLDTFLSTLKTI